MFTRAAAASVAPQATPWGIGYWAPSGEARPWTAPNPAWARHIPEHSAAYAIRSRAAAATLPGPAAPRPATASSNHGSNPSRADARPERASASVKGLACADTYDSSSWVSASMPLAAISSGGQLDNRSGSTIATRATSDSSRNDFLKPPAPRTLRTAFFVASLPVPAVVGTAMNGTGGPRYGSS